jgi:hypothetical protein
MTPRDNQFFVAQLAAEAKGRCYHFDAATTKIHEMYPLNSETRNGPFSSALSSRSFEAARLRVCTALAGERHLKKADLPTQSS